MATSPAAGRERHVTRIAGLVVVVATALAVGLLLGEFPDMVGPVVVGGVGFVLLAVVLRVSAGRARSVTGLGAGLLVFPAGVAITGGVVSATLLVVEEVFPVPEQALLSVGWLTIVGHVGVVLGCTISVFGLALARRNRLDRDTLTQGTYVAVASGLVPMVVAALFVLIAVDSGETADTAVVAPLAGPVQWLLTPVALVVPDRFLVLLLLVALVVALALGIGRLQQRLAASDISPGPRIAGAIAGGAVGTIWTVAISEWAYDRVVEELLRRFPVEIEGEIRDASTTTATTYGESTAILLAVLLCLGLAVTLLVVVYLFVAANLLSTESPGASLAGVGLFVATVFGGTVGAPAWLVVTGVAASLLVWDAGRFGTTLAREVGSGRSRRVELVHLGAALLVGIAAVAVALVLIGRLPADPEDTAAAGTELLALCSVVVGLLSLVLALR
jgi:hypothetical protein